MVGQDFQPKETNLNPSFVEGFFVFIRIYCDMRELIKTILRENNNVEKIKRNEIEIPKKLPSIVKFIKSKYGNSVRVKTDSKSVYFGSDNYRGTCKEIKIFVEDERLVAAEVKVDLWRDINNFFDIDMTRYGSCLYLEVYRKKWEKI